MAWAVGMADNADKEQGASAQEKKQPENKKGEAVWQEQACASFCSINYICQ